MRIIDAHTHIFPDKIAVKAAKSIGAFYDVTMSYAASADLLLEDGAKIGVEKYLVCSSAVTADQVVSINDFIAGECRKHPEFIGFAAMHRDFEDYEAELDRALSLGLCGVKFHNDFQKFNIDDEKMFPIYEAISERGMKVLFHMGDDRYDYSAPARLTRVAEAFPDMICIGAHFGGYQRWSEAYEMPVLPNVYFDTSSTLEWLDAETARRMIERFGAEHFMFGTDFPMWDAGEELERFMKLELGDEINEMILWKNFCRLYNIPTEY